jgi:hypothetical protein
MTTIPQDIHFLLLIHPSSMVPLLLWTSVPYDPHAMTHPSGGETDIVQALRDEFRSHLETFYSQLKLAPPYESVEKAIRALTTAVHTLPKTEQARLAHESDLKWAQFRRAFETSGLAKKHRGIIAGLARDRQGLDLPPEYDQFLTLFTSMSS